MHYTHNPYHTPRKSYTPLTGKETEAQMHSAQNCNCEQQVWDLNPDLLDSETTLMVIWLVHLS